MPNGRTVRYDGRTEETRFLLTGGWGTHLPNIVYKSVGGNNMMYYINMRGYFHILCPRLVEGEVNGSGKDYWTVEDRLLRPSNTLAYYSSYGYFNTMADCIHFMESELLGNSLHYGD